MLSAINYHYCLFGKLNALTIISINYIIIKLKNSLKEALFMEKNVKIVVKSSKCDMYKPGDEIYLDKSFINKEKSANICLTAISAIYPFVYAARKGVTGEQMGFPDLTFQCPDCPDVVEFTIVQLD